VSGAGPYDGDVPRLRAPPDRSSRPPASHPRGPLRDRQRGRPRWDGHGVPGERPEAPPISRHQGFFHPELATSLGVERFLREIGIAAGLTHPHILALYDSGHAGDLLYYVMPYIEGKTLRGRLERERQLSIVDAVRIASEVADALGYAHSRGVVHRDIKPEKHHVLGGQRRRGRLRDRPRSDGCDARALTAAA